MSLTQIARGRSRRIAAALVASLALAAAVGTPAEAVQPAGSRAAVQLETGNQTGSPADAITSGWWGHEGGANDGTGTGSTILSMDATDGAGGAPDVANILAKMDTNDVSNIYFAIVPTSADGSAETPTITPGENAAQAFGHVLYQNFGGGLNGTSGANDSVALVSTQAQVSAWVAAGRPVQGFDNNLVLHDATAPGNPISTAPQGTSILNTWPAGTHLSLVAFVAAGMDPNLDNQVPLVAADGSGKAKTAWLPFITVGKPGDSLRTSAGYQVVGPYAPTLALASTYAGSTGTLTATIKTKAGAVATDATGSVEFAPVVNGSTGTATPVAVSAGKAALSIPNFAPGTSKTYDVRYVPDTAGQASYLTTGYTRTTMINPLATSTALKVTGGTTDTFTATVTPAVAGRVVFKDGATTLATVTASGGVAKYAKKLAGGKHVLSAAFTPSTSTYAASSATRTVWQPTIGTTLKPSRVVHGTRPKLIVKVVATGTTVSGKVTLVFDPPTGATKRITVTLSAGSATVLLPKTVKGTTRITVMYLGNSTVLAANKLISFKAS